MGGARLAYLRPSLDRRASGMPHADTHTATSLPAMLQAVMRVPSVLSLLWYSESSRAGAINFDSVTTYRDIFGSLVAVYFYCYAGPLSCHPASSLLILPRPYLSCLARNQSVRGIVARAAWLDRVACQRERLPAGVSSTLFAPPPPALPHPRRLRPAVPAARLFHAPAALHAGSGVHQRDSRAAGAVGVVGATGVSCWRCGRGAGVSVALVLLALWIPQTYVGGAPCIQRRRLASQCPR